MRSRSWLARLVRLLRGGDASPARVAASCALGLFIGCLPLYGLHFPLCLGACLLLRLDLLIAYLAANISNPLVAPFLITAEVEIGSLLLRGEHAAFDVERAREVGVTGFAAQAAVGSLVVGGALALLGGAAAYAVASRRTRATTPELRAAVRRTLERYRQERIADRQYVRGKLGHDPALARILELEGSLGDTVDVGAGFGQLGLCLLELGRATSLCGFDLDERKIRVAQRAAGADARFEVRDVAHAELEPCDTILAVDVLHYLPRSEQDAFLARAARALRPSGRLLLRDADRNASASSGVTRLFEYVATTLGLHRTRSKLCFRPARELVAVLEAEGLSCRVIQAAQGTPFANVLVIATRAG